MVHRDALDLTLVQRSLTGREAQCVHQELKSTPNILGYTVRELRRLQNVWVAESQGELAGVCACHDLAGNWTEISFLYILPGFRGQGLGKRLFVRAWEQARCRQRHVFVLSRNPQVIGWMTELGMTLDSRFWAAPWPVQWHMHKHMASWYRCREQWRKWRMIRTGPALVQGIQRAAASKQIGCSPARHDNRGSTGRS